LTACAASRENDDRQESRRYFAPGFAAGSIRLDDITSPSFGFAASCPSLSFLLAFSLNPMNIHRAIGVCASAAF
jgi:hypothetical protein